MNDKIHAFEDRGLGKAPFVCVGLYSLPSKSLAEQNPSAHNAALAGMPTGYGVGSCAFCGAALIHNYMIRSTDGWRFCVGCECVQKTGDEGLIKRLTAMEKERKRELREAAWRRRRAAREAILAEKWAGIAEQERRENGGWTLDEIGQLRRAVAAEILKPIALWLNDGRGGFRQSVAIDMATFGRIPSGGAINIVLDIAGKQAGKRGSKAYDLAFDVTDKIIADAEEIYAMDNEQFVRRYGNGNQDWQQGAV